ncbi:MAG: UDP-N-acetylmuramoyl-L-alanyl-D-glutamate--2,6-diaminopimelate ligase [Firmicutes bacterium]|nr:UDP-N-acetylmuramoyl-L-alanyl-D-glutamate--2,6-diaminopimelate ligase [Bacillota bacterium]
MTIDELARCLSQVDLRGDPDTKIQGIAYDSRQVRPGDLFVCIKGFRFDGHAFISDALERGAVGLVVDDSSMIPRRDQYCGEEGFAPVPASVPVLYTKDTRKALGLLGACFYRYPSRKLGLIGVTGTKGKTTTTYLIKSILEAAGHRVGLIGTIQNVIGNKSLPTERTTPESVDLQSLFSQMVDDACDYAVMEVSSHALKLQRTIGSEFDIGVFTNLSQDHLDFHPSFQDYLDTKTGFFANLGIEGTTKHKTAILNYDERYCDYIRERTSVSVITYGTRSGATYRARDIAIGTSGLTYRLEHPGGEELIDLPMTGYFNVYNSLAALSTCLAVGIDLPVAVRGLETARPVPGRLEPIERGQDFTVLVDYAHNPASLENALETVKGLTRGRSIVVFGCGGDRDRTKRPLMGEIAGRLADAVIVTSDNPRSETPELICEEIGVGVSKTIGDKPWAIIVDRHRAIKRAVQMAESGDTVLIAGKGHEPYQILKDRTIHFDDREEAARALDEHLESR